MTLEASNPSSTNHPSAQNEPKGAVQSKPKSTPWCRHFTADGTRCRLPILDTRSHLCFRHASLNAAAAQPEHYDSEDLSADLQNSPSSPPAPTSANSSAAFPPSSPKAASAPAAPPSSPTHQSTPPLSPRHHPRIQLSQERHPNHLRHPPSTIGSTPGPKTPPIRNSAHDPLLPSRSCLCREAVL